MFVSQPSEVNHSCKSISTVLLKRLPIYDNKMNVYAYELMPYTRKSEYVDDDTKRADLLINALINFDFASLTGDAKVLLPVSEMLLSELENLPFNKDKTIYGLPENYDFNEANTNKINTWVSEGYQFAYTLNRSVGEMVDQVPNVSLVKINAAQFNAKNLEAITLAGKHNFVISNIKTKEEYEYYCKIGFKFCQGYFLGQSVIYKSKNVGSDLGNVLDLLSKVNNSETTVEELEATLMRDVALTYKLMRFMNSPYFNTRVSIDSVKQALVLIGQKELRIWVSMLVLSGRDDVPSVVSELVLFRAKFCELLAEKAECSDKDVFFTAGLFSGLDMVLCASLESILGSLPLSGELNEALLEYKGSLGEAILCAKSYESGDMGKVSFQNLSDQQIGETFEQAVAWSYEVMSCF